jgi:DeoR/GlpR family transcriptional regulator of sugar metabolism
MLKTERHQFIMTKILEEQKVSTVDLAHDLNISEDTIRRDLNELDSKGMLEKVYGGAFPVKDKPVSVFDIVISNEEEKKIISHKALSLLHDGQVIIMSGGTTNLVLAKLIPLDLKATIYTYSLPIAMQLSQHPNIELMFIGGKMQKNAMVTIGIDVIQVLSKLKADVCFMGVSSINTKLGLTEKGYEVSIIKKAMMQSSDKVVALVSSEKLDTKMPYVVGELNQLNTIITNLDPSDPKLEGYLNSGVIIL